MSDQLVNHNAPYAVSMDSTAVLRYLQQYAALGANPRKGTLDRLDQQWRGQQYNHQKIDWWGRNADNYETLAPLENVPPGFEIPANANILSRDKRPTAPANSSKFVIRRYTRLLFSRSRKPSITVAGDPDSDAFLEAVFKKARFWNVMKMARNKGGAMGSVAVTVHLREGSFVYEVHNPKQLQVVWKDRRTWEPLGFLKMFVYTQLEPSYGKDGKFEGMVEVSYVYRRIMTADHDVVYKPVPWVPGQPMAWDVETSLSVQHNLGFFPGAWIQNHPEDEEQDGSPDCDGAFPSFDAIDRLNSQSNKALLQNQDPTLILKYDTKEIGGGTVSTGSDGALSVGPSGDAKFLEISAQGVEASRKFVADLRRQWQEVTGMVPLDPEKMAGSAQSALAMELLMQPTIEVADDLREQYGTAIRQLCDLTLKMARKFTTARVAMPGGRVGVYQFDLPPALVEETDPATGAKRSTLRPQPLGPGGPIEIEWGPYFEDTESDKSSKIANAVAAYAGGGIDEEAKIKAICSVFGLEATQPLIERIKQESAERAAAERAAMSFGEVPFNRPVDDTQAPPATPPVGAPPPVPLTP